MPHSRGEEIDRKRAQARIAARRKQQGRALKPRTNGLDKVAIGRRIRTLRESAGLTIQELASRLGVTAPAISWWETGRNSPRGDLRLRLADTLGTTVRYILTGENERTSASDVSTERAQEAIELARRELARMLVVDPSKIKYLSSISAWRVRRGQTGRKALRMENSWDTS